MVSAARAMAGFAASAAPRVPTASPGHLMTCRSEKMRSMMRTRSMVSASRKATTAVPVEPPFEPPAEGVWCDPRRVRVLRGSMEPKGDGPVVYWMSRERRVLDNWALNNALEVAARTNRGFHVVYILDYEKDLVQGARQRVFEIQGLREVDEKLREMNIPFHVTDANDNASGSNTKTNSKAVIAALEKFGPSLVVCDFSPLREPRKTRDDIVTLLCPCDVPVTETDARNVVPVWQTSDKKEYAARTIRKKIMSRLDVFCTEFPGKEAIEFSMRRVLEGSDGTVNSNGIMDSSTLATPFSDKADWDALLEIAKNSAGARPIYSKTRGLTSGETAGLRHLTQFVTNRIHLYIKRNDPNVIGGQSGLSPYIRFGYVSAQRAALEARKALMDARGDFDESSMNTSISASGTETDPFMDTLTDATNSFIEELVVRRELAENFVAYTSQYDTLAGTTAQWAMDSLTMHETDKRDPSYTFDQLENAQTHDELWNAAQLELTELGQMHGFMRMYWAKKILEWTSDGPSKAFEIALYFNDRYSLDGRDPNGCTGVAWAIAGLHDQGWKEREVFGKIRYMNYQGCKRKFKVDQYVARINDEVREETQTRESIER